MTLLATVTIMTVSFVGCAGNGVSAVNNISTVGEGITSNAYELLKEFALTHPNRTTGYVEYNENGHRVDPAKNAAEWIANKLLKMGYMPNGDNGNLYGLQEFSFQNTSASTTENGYNVVFEKKASGEAVEKVVIATHYDNVTKLNNGDSVIGGDGTYNNATGVIALLETANAIKDLDLPFNVEFVAFGGNELGMIGSQHYINNLNLQEKQEILLMINFDRVAGGDYVYMYSGELDTKHHDFMYEIAEQNSCNIEPLPYDLRNYLLSFEGSNMIYSNEAMLADSYVFGLEDINYVNFLSMNFSDRSVAGAVERSGLVNIAYTSQDNFANFEKRLGGTDQANLIVNGQIDAVVDTVVNALQDDSFKDTMIASMNSEKADWLLDGKTMSIVTYSVIGGIIIILLVLYFALKSGTKSHKVYIDTPYGKYDIETRTFVGSTIGGEDKRTAEEIFGIDDKNDATKDKNSTETKINNDEDIFGQF